jgi:hypothetical protein
MLWFGRNGFVFLGFNWLRSQLNLTNWRKL